MNTVTPDPALLLTGEARRRLAGTLLGPWLEAEGGGLTVQCAASGRFSHVDAAVAAWLGLEADEMLGRTESELLPAALATRLRAAAQAASERAEGLLTEHTLEREGRCTELAVLRRVVEVDGRRWLCAVWADRSGARRHERQLQQALQQIEQLQRANEALRGELADQSLRDPVTGLHRRAHFDDQLRRELDLSAREHREFAVVFIALDPWTEAVQAAGEAGQGAVTAALGRLLRSGTRAMDASCRYDDGRLAVLLSGVGLATAHARMEALRRHCAAQVVVHDGHEMGFSVAMGVASYPHTAQDRDALLQACEKALGGARQRGGNQVAMAAIAFGVA